MFYKHWSHFEWLSLLLVNFEDICYRLNVEENIEMLCDSHVGPFVKVFSPNHLTIIYRIYSKSDNPR